jgi:hypothetical protein
VSEQTGDTSTGATTAAPGGDQTGTDGPGTGTEPTTSGDQGGTLDTLPPWAQKLIGDARKGEERYRRQAREAQEAQRRDTETRDAVLSALGLKPDGADDPAKVTEALSSAQAAQRQTAVELAVYRAAAKSGADPDALLDSRAFLAAVQDVDPGDGDAIADAIKTAVASNPRLAKAATAPAAPARSGGDFTGSPTADGQVTEAELTAMSPEEIVKALESGRLKNLL